MLEPVHGTPEWRVLKDRHNHQLFSSLMAAKGWLEHVLEHGEQTKLAASLNCEDEQDEERDERMDRGDWEFHRDHDQ
jgi:hypothetical protein